MALERRVYPTQFRDVKGSDRQKWATAVTYDTVDDFGTIWLPGVFDKALAERMPTMLYGHDWENLSHVLGKGIDSRQTPVDVGPPGVDILMEFDDPDYVPMVRQAMYQVEHRTIKDASVGFVREEWLRTHDLTQEQRSAGGKEAMQQAGLDELSLVVRGAVPGAQFRSRRSGGTVDLDAVLEIARRKAAGELTDDEAKAAVDLLAGPDETDPEGTPPPADGEGEPDPVVEGDTAELDAALALIGRTVPAGERRFANILTDDVRTMLSAALKIRFPGGDNQWMWIRDFSDTEVIFDLEGYDNAGCYRMGYSLVKGLVKLDAGDPLAVQPKTTYIPRK